MDLVETNPYESQEMGLSKPSSTVKLVRNGHSQKDRDLFDLMQVTSIEKCSHWSILQYFRPSLSYHLSLKYLFVYFEWTFNTGFTVCFWHCFTISGRSSNRLPRRAAGEVGTWVSLDLIPLVDYIFTNLLKYLLRSRI